MTWKDLEVFFDTRIKHKTGAVRSPEEIERYREERIISNLCYMDPDLPLEDQVLLTTKEWNLFEDYVDMRISAIAECRC